MQETIANSQNMLIVNTWFLCCLRKQRKTTWARSDLMAFFAQVLAVIVEDLAGVWEKVKKGRRLRFPSRLMQNHLIIPAE